MHAPGEMRAAYEGGDRMVASIRGHRVLVDQPPEAGGEDGGPTPTELFVAGLVTCVLFFAERFLRRNGLPTDGLAVACRFSLTEDPPARVDAVELKVALPDGLDERWHAPLLRVVDHCTVHNTLREPPEVSIRLEAAERAA